MGPDLTEALSVWKRSKTFKPTRAQWADILSELGAASKTDVLDFLCIEASPANVSRPAREKSAVELAVEGAFAKVRGKKDDKLIEFVSHLPPEGREILIRYRTFTKVMPALVAALGEQVILDAVPLYAAAKAKQAKTGGIRPKVA